MKYWVIFLLGCFVIGSLASPIVVSSKDLKHQEEERGRQDQNNQVNTDDDDDDEDDDEEDIDIGEDDDDDDDDEEEESAAGTAAQSDDDDDDDDEGDYFERFFDDILGDDDDDEEDDEEPASSASQPVVVSAQPEVTAELQPSEQSAGEIQYDEDGENNVVATIDNANTEAEKDQASTAAAAAAAAPTTASPASQQPVVSEESEEDDDDDDLGIEEEDDDDDEEEEDDDDDEDEDIEDVIDGRSRKGGRAVEPASPRVPPSFILKYNRYVDNVLERINKVLRTGYDPVNVRLHSVKNKKKNTSKKNKKKKARSHSIQESDSEVNVTISSVTVSEIEETTMAEVKADSRAKTKKNNGKNKEQGKPRAKATLFGMASLKRSDDVSVNLMSSHTTIKSKFTIGPLTLKVEKEFGRGAKKELRSATATTTEMVGRINLRLEHGGRATLHSIRVMQPNLLRVDTPDDHDKTREFVWRRSSHIAQIVSQKLTKAAKSLMPPENASATTVKPKKKKPADSGLLSYLF